MADPTAAALDLTDVARQVVDVHRAAPCACVGAALYRGGAWHCGLGAFGALWFGGDAPPASLETIFDLASLTKPVTALTFARLERAGVLARTERLADVLPALGATRSARVPLDLFLAHRAGLDAHRQLYAPLVEGKRVIAAEALVEAADARRADCMGDPPAGGFPPIYSDLGYLLLGAAIAARGGADFDRVTSRETSEPLGVSIGSARMLRDRGSGFDASVAPTEVVDWRGGVVRGDVHDENAWAVAGHGAAGHAGLFGDVRSVLHLGMRVLDAIAGRAGEWLRSEDMSPLIEPRPGGSLLAGFDRRSGDAPSSGRRFGPRTFGHLGFTGTSIWMDPEQELVGVLLTNRVHPTRATDAIRRARPVAYDALANAMLGDGGEFGSE